MRLQLQIILVLLPFFTLASAGTKYPVILVPGDGGSQLYAKLNKTTSKHWYCEKSTSGQYVNIWVNLEDFAPGVTTCFVDNMMLIYDNKTRKTYSPEGVDVKTLPLGDTASVEWLDPSTFSHEFSSLTYFYQIAQDLVAAGFERNVSIRGAPFDFRKAPNELGDFYNELKQLVEDTYVLNNGTKCVFVAHSMGNPVLLYFLNHQPQEWKDKYIQSFVSLAGVWAGAVKPLRLFASGDSLGVVVVWPNTVRREQRAMPSTAFLMPSDKFWTPDEVMIITEERNYTIVDYKQFFEDINFMDGWNMHLDTKDLIWNLTAPGVRLHCVHGLNLPTPGTLVFKKGEFPDVFPGNIPDNGDGTVNQRSLEACLEWQGKQKYKVDHVVLDKAEHMEILADTRARNYIVQVATGQV